LLSLDVVLVHGVAILFCERVATSRLYGCRFLERSVFRKGKWCA
jgi:hypothetical protein